MRRAAERGVARVAIDARFGTDDAMPVAHDMADAASGRAPTVMSENTRRAALPFGGTRQAFSDTVWNR